MKRDDLLAILPRMPLPEVGADPVQFMLKAVGANGELLLYAPPRLVALRPDALCPPGVEGPLMQPGQLALRKPGGQTVFLAVVTWKVAEGWIDLGGDGCPTLRVQFINGGLLDLVLGAFEAEPEPASFAATSDEVDK